MGQLLVALDALDAAEKQTREPFGWMNVNGCGNGYVWRSEAEAKRNAGYDPFRVAVPVYERTSEADGLRIGELIEKLELAEEAIAKLTAERDAAEARAKELEASERNWAKHWKVAAEERGENAAIASLALSTGAEECARLRAIITDIHDETGCVQPHLSTPEIDSVCAKERHSGAVEEWNESARDLREAKRQLVDITDKYNLACFNAERAESRAEWYRLAFERVWKLWSESEATGEMLCTIGRAAVVEAEERARTMHRRAQRLEGIEQRFEQVKENMNRERRDQLAAAHYTADLIAQRLRDEVEKLRKAGVPDWHPNEKGENSGVRTGYLNILVDRIIAERDELREALRALFGDEDVSVHLEDSCGACVACGREYAHADACVVGKARALLAKQGAL